MLIEMENVSFRRDQKTILGDINWQVENGQHWAILGMNGAGKTTLLNLVCGYLFPTTGSIHVLDKPFGRYPLNELRKQIGWVSMSFADKMRHHTASKGLQIVLSGKFASIGLYEQPSTADIDKAMDWMERLEIAHLQSQPFANMSQGEKQRTLIGRALMAAPRLLILDEPCAGLDFLSKEQLLSTISRMAGEQQITLIYVTHQIDEILPMFTHTLLLSHGHIFTQGRTEDQLTSQTLSAFCDTNVQVTHSNDRYFLHLQTKISI